MVIFGKKTCSLLIIMLFYLLSVSFVSADVFTGNITLQINSSNASSMFNFNTRTLVSGGQLQFRNHTGVTVPGVYLTVTNKTGLMDLGFWSDDEGAFSGNDFSDELVMVHNRSFSRFDGSLKDYYRNASTVSGPSSGLIDMQAYIGKIYALELQNASGTSRYAAIYIKSIGSGNVTFVYKYNNQSGNGSFSDLEICDTYTGNQTSCFAAKESQCIWEDYEGLCEPGDFGDFDTPPADCGFLPERACKGINNSFCYWNQSLGTQGLCQRGPSFDFGIGGFNCTAILNHSVCTNSSFTVKTGLCTWIGTTCGVNRTKTVDDIPEPPVFSCEAPSAVANRTLCDYLANQSFMPCGWNNKTNRCGGIFFDFGQVGGFEDISSESSCTSFGGAWKSESAYDPGTKKLTTESWCEFGAQVQKFSDFGKGGKDFSGPSGMLGDCSVSCFACEYNSTGGRWPNSANASLACMNSAEGCIFESNTNAFNGHGWCKPSQEFGGFDCDEQCGDCNLKPNAYGACVNSSAQCRWDNVSSVCIGSGQKSCGQDCFSCQDQNGCQNTTASGGCEWDSSSFFCKPRGGTYEICFDDVDNDNDGNTDCEDFKCGSDPFCAGESFDDDKCFQYDLFTYGLNAQGNCTVNGCGWITDSFNFSFCAPKEEQCYLNESLSTQAACDGYDGGGMCTFRTASVCEENMTMMRDCFGARNQSTCGERSGCVWFSQGSGGGYCDLTPITVCEENATLQSNQTLCESVGCAWRGNIFGGGFEGGPGFHENCISPCLDPLITTREQCGNATANATPFVNGTCVWQTGMCEPLDFIGGCFEHDGDVAACRANDNCGWFEPPMGFAPLRNPNGSTNFTDIRQVQANFMAVGLQLPQGGENVSILTINTTGNAAKSVRLVMAQDNVNFKQGITISNTSRLYCNTTLVMAYNWSSDGCEAGTCNQYNISLCSGANLHYYLNNATRQLEVLWEVGVDFKMDGVTGNENLTDTQNTSTVIVDGNLSEHLSEGNSTSLDGITNATRVRTVRGFCNDAMMGAFFEGMDQEPPIVIAGDTLNGAGDPSEDYLDIEGLGVKKTPEAYMYGIPVDGLAASALCHGTSIEGGMAGSGKNLSRYYLYLDTDGKTTGGCSPGDDSSIAGFEYLFKYVAELADNKLEETFLSQQCKNSSWVPSSIPFKSDKFKSCGFVGGPIFAIGKDSFTSKSNVNISKGWRAYATSAHNAGNTSNVSDKVGPGTTDFQGIDAEFVDCTDPANKDSSQCTKFKQYGFFPGEFGPACKDSKDNDGDSLTDCDDYDCKYDPFFCSGTFAAVADDKSSPSLAWAKVNTKHPTQLDFIFDTNEPANGTVKFYNNDSSCSVVNATVRDAALDDGDAFTDYRPHHVADIDKLRPNSTYFYKFLSCDPAGNCVTSSCSNVTTAVAFTNITFKIAIPENWTVDIPSINISNYTARYALKASVELLDDINITVKAPDNKSSITFVGVDIFEKQTFNVSAFSFGSGFIGVDANQYQSFKQKAGVDEAFVTINTTGDQLQHCDDSGESCKNVTGRVSCVFGATETNCRIPDAVGLGFSSYKAATSTSSSSGSSSSGSSGGGGGGGSSSSSGGASAGGSVASATNIVSKTWANIDAGKSVSMAVSSKDIAVTSIEIGAANKLTNAKVTFMSRTDTPLLASDFDGKVYQYFDIVKSNFENSDISGATLTFTVPSSWLTEKGAAANEVALYRFVDKVWTKLETTSLGLAAGVHTYSARTPGFSYFVIGVETVEEPIVAETLAPTVVPHVEPVPAALAATSSSWFGTAVIVALLVAACIIVFYVLRKKNRRKPY